VLTCGACRKVVPELAVTGGAVIDPNDKDKSSSRMLIDLTSEGGLAVFVALS